MNPFACHLALRPRDPLDVLDLTVVLVRARWRPLARFAGAVLLPLSLVFGFAAWWSEGAWWLGLAALAVGPAVQAPLTLLAGRLLFAEDSSVVEAFRGVGERASALLGVVAVAAGVVLVSSLTCFVGAPLFLGPLAFSGEAALLERVDAGRALRRSARLAAAQPAAATAVVLGRVALTLWCAVTFELAGQGLVATVLQLGEPFGAALDGACTPYLLSGVLVAHALHGLYRLLVYVDARTRSEGWDLQVSLRAAGLVA